MTRSSSPFRNLRRQASNVLVGLVGFYQTSVFAQDAGAAPAPVSSRPMYLEWGITIGMIGLALFVVCRRSNRT